MASAPGAGLAGRELPPAQVLAADQRITAWAKELRAAGLDGDMDVLRARAYMDILLGMDSRLAIRDGAARPGGPAVGEPDAFIGEPDPFVPPVGGEPGYGSWRLSTGVPGQPDLIIAVHPIATKECDHRFEAAGHDPGAMLRHLSQIRHATCTAPTCRRPASNCDYEHNVPYETGGRTCLCNGSPKCRGDHRLKQDPRWKVDQHPDGTFTWTTPSGRQYRTEPTRYPI